MLIGRISCMITESYVFTILILIELFEIKSIGAFLILEECCSYSKDSPEYKQDLLPNQNIQCLPRRTPLRFAKIQVQVTLSDDKHLMLQYRSKLLLLYTIYRRQKNILLDVPELVRNANDIIKCVIVNDWERV